MAHTRHVGQTLAYYLGQCVPWAVSLLGHKPCRQAYAADRSQHATGDTWQPCKPNSDWGPGTPHTKASVCKQTASCLQRLHLGAKGPAAPVAPPWPNATPLVAGCHAPLAAAIHITDYVPLPHSIHLLAWSAQNLILLIHLLGSCDAMWDATATSQAGADGALLSLPPPHSEARLVSSPVCWGSMPAPSCTTPGRPPAALLPGAAADGEGAAAG